MESGAVCVGHSLRSLMSMYCAVSLVTMDQVRRNIHEIY